MKSALAALVVSLAAAAALAAEPQPRIALEPELGRELVRRTKEDQAARFAMIRWMSAHGGGVGAFSPTDLPPEDQAEFQKLTARVGQADAENTKWLKQVVDTHGWPAVSMVGKDGAQAAWLLVQHADADRRFQRHCLDLMTKLPKEEVSPSNLAYLTDRVLLAEGKEQIYGTQFISKDGKLQPRPIADEAHVDARRAEIGLPPLAEYAKIIKREYGPATK